MNLKALEEERTVTEHPFDKKEDVKSKETCTHIRIKIGQWVREDTKMADTIQNQGLRPTPGSFATFLNFPGFFTSIVCFLFPLPLLASRRVGPRRPIWVKLHMQLPLPSGEFVILSLFFSTKGMPLTNKNRTERLETLSKKKKIRWTSEKGPKIDAGKVVWC